MTLTEDTTQGVHDTLVSPCDSGRYRLLGVEGYHPSCTDNYREALRGFPHLPEHVLELTPAPLNLFMNVKVSTGGQLTFEVPSSEAGQHVCLKALMPVIVVMSACPMDLRAANGWNPTECHYVIMDE